MSTPDAHPDPGSRPPVAPTRSVRWDAVAAVIAALVGLLALVVAGYTAWIQRQQVRAQVWPYVISGNNSLAQSLLVDNKGVGPALVRSVQVRVDGHPQRDWQHVMAALGLHLPPHSFMQTTVNHYVLSAAEELQFIRFPDPGVWQQFHDAARNRLAVDICFCSTLGDCWHSRNRNLIGPLSMSLQLTVTPTDKCAQLPASDVFNN